MSRIIPLPPVYEEFWRSREREMAREFQLCEPGSVRRMVANVFWLKAQEMVRKLEERKRAVAFAPWGLYVARANRIAQEFNPALEVER